MNAEEDTTGDEDAAGGGEGANDALVQGEKRYTVDISAVVSQQQKANFSKLFTTYLRQNVHGCVVSHPNADQINVTCSNINKKAIKNLLHNFMKSGKYGRMKISVPQNSPSALELQTRD